MMSLCSRHRVIDELIDVLFPAVNTTFKVYIEPLPFPIAWFITIPLYVLMLRPVMTIHGWHTLALCHYDNARRNCHRCRDGSMVHFETRVVRRHVGMFLASQGFSVSLEELAAVRD
jgi:hypothetical protein